MIIKIVFIINVFWGLISAQDSRQDIGSFVEYKSAFWKQVEEEIDTYSKNSGKSNKYFKVDVSNWDLPSDLTTFSQFWHNEPVNQGRTGTCWSFSSISYFESEIYRQTGKKYRLSVMHTVYWETVEKARRFAKERGNSEFSQGSLFNATVREWQKYGAVPQDVYTGLKPEQIHHDHSALWKEMRTYLEHIKNTNNWNENEVVSTVKSILNFHLGEPPATFIINKKSYTPKQYLKKVLKLDLDDYVNLMSLKEIPYYELGEYDVPDNWWNNAEYHNLPLEVFMTTIDETIEKGYTIGIGGDVSEAGMLAKQDVAVIPSFDIPTKYIDDHARQFRFSNHATTDDHAMHMVGYKDHGGARWYLIKDSGSGGHSGNLAGYYFYHEDYVKLKMMNLIIHKDALTTLLKKFNQE